MPREGRIGALSGRNDPDRRRLREPVTRTSFRIDERAILGDPDPSHLSTTTPQTDLKIRENFDSESNDRSGRSHFVIVYSVSQWVVCGVIRG